MPLSDGRGTGLGNELIAWGKAFIGAQALGLNLLHPAWGLNPRAYWRYFGTSRLDWLTHWSLRHVFPVFHFTENDFRQSRDLDLHQAVCAFAERHELERRSAFVLCFSGMWGGLPSIADAREFLRAQLLSTHRTCENLYELQRRLRGIAVRIGFHIRRGDFSGTPANAAYRNRFNTAIPMDWYVAVARNLSKGLLGEILFLIVSDGSEQELRPLTDEFRCVVTSDLASRDISDLLALASCDLIVCSVSSFSLAAAFLSKGRYIWFEPNLNIHDGLRSIWGHEPAQLTQFGETARNLARVRAEVAAGTTAATRGVPVDWDGDLPAELLSDLEIKGQLAQRHTDLIQYGVVSGTS